MKRILQKVWCVCRKILGWFCVLVAALSIYTGITSPESGLTLPGIVMGVIAFLLLRKRKLKDKALEVQVPQPEPELEREMDPELEKMIFQAQESEPDFIPPDPINEPEIEVPDAYITVGNSIYRTDGKPIEDREIPHLIELGFQQAQKQYQQSNAPKWSRTPEEEELSFQFCMKYGGISDRKSNLFRDYARAAYQTDDINERINLLNLAVQRYNEAKEWHYKKSKGGEIWFQDMWEYMGSIERGYYSWVDGVEEALKFWISVRDNVIPGLLRILSDGPAIQKDLYVHFPDIGKSDLRKIIDILVKQGKVSKEKKGSSYLLTAC